MEWWLPEALRDDGRGQRDLPTDTRRYRKIGGMNCRTCYIGGYHLPKMYCAVQDNIRILIVVTINKW